jgi:hypothetical protein
VYNQCSGCCSRLAIILHFNCGLRSSGRTLIFSHA